MSDRLAGVRAICPWLFLIFVLASGGYLAWNLPPFMGADELQHLQRADLTTHGRLTGARVGPPDHLFPGGNVDPALAQAAAAFQPMAGRPDLKVELEAFQTASQIRLSPTVDQGGFTGAAAYPPVFYLPASAALAIGRHLQWPVVRALYLARAANLFACALVGFLALWLAGRRAQIPLFAVLTLPMAFALYASVTCDGLLIATTALAAALISRSMDQARPMRTGELFAVAACLVLVGATKPPYAVLALTLFAVPAVRRRDRILAAGSVLVLSLAWTIWMALTVATPNGRPWPGIDMSGQLAGLAGSPLAIAQLAQATLAAHGQDYARMFVGVLGWLDTPLPAPFYPLALTVLVATFAAAGLGPAAAGWRRAQLIALASILIAAGGVFLALYLSWTPVGAPVIEGVQGRYFLPLAAFAVCLVSAPVREAPSWLASLRLAVSCSAVVLPLLSLAVIERAVTVRYYIG